MLQSTHFVLLTHTKQYIHKSNSQTLNICNGSVQPSNSVDFFCGKHACKFRGMRGTKWLQVLQYILFLTFRARESSLRCVEPSDPVRSAGLWWWGALSMPHHTAGQWGASPILHCSQAARRSRRPSLSTSLSWVHAGPFWPVSGK